MEVTIPVYNSIAEAENAEGKRDKRMKYAYIIIDSQDSSFITVNGIAADGDILFVTTDSLASTPIHVMVDRLRGRLKGWLKASAVTRAIE